MSLLFADGFSWVPTAAPNWNDGALNTLLRWDQQTGQVPMYRSPGRSGFGQYVNLGFLGNQNTLIKFIPLTNELIIQFAMSINWLGSTSLLYFYKGGLPQCYFNYDSGTGMISLYRATVWFPFWGALIAEWGPYGVVGNWQTHPPPAWHHYGIRLNIAHAGSYKFYRDGVLLSQGNGDLQYQPASGADSVKLCSFPFDDFLIMDTNGLYMNDYLGDCFIYTQFPSAPGYSTQWAPVGAPTNWQAVTGLYHGDVSYVDDSTVGHIDAYMHDALPVNGTIFGIQPVTFARKNDAIPHTVRSLYRPAGAILNQESADIVLAVGYQAWDLTSYINPQTGLPWVTAEVDVCQSGVRYTS
jgi:hypothetical protein